MVTCAVPYVNLPSNSANVLFLPTLVYLACKRNDTVFADVIDTSSLNRFSIDPLVNYRETPETDHRCGDTVTGHRSIHVSRASFLPVLPLNFASLPHYLSFLFTFISRSIFLVSFLFIHLFIFIEISRNVLSLVSRLFLIFFLLRIATIMNNFDYSISLLLLY